MRRAAFLGLVAAVASKECPSECRDPICNPGGAFNGGEGLVGGLCQQSCSRKFGAIRYCGKGTSYEEGDFVDCRSCVPPKSEVEDDKQSSSASPASPESIRTALLQEARQRLESWYQDQAALELPFWSYQARVQQTKQWYFCDFKGGNMQVPVTFGEFNVSGAAPVYVFNALSDVEKQMSWDTTVSQINLLKDYEKDGVRAVQMELPSGIFMVPAREVFEWLAFNASVKEQEFWFVVSTLENEPMHEVRHVDRSAVQANNCLGAYWIRPCPKGGEQNCPSGNPENCCPDGGSRVIWTSHVNVHPPAVITAKTIFDASWPKQIEWINSLKKKALELVKEVNSTSLPPVTLSPDWLWKDSISSGTGVVFSFPSAFSSGEDHLTRLFELGMRLPGREEFPTGLAVFLGAAFLTVAVRKWRILALRRKASEVCHVPPALLAADDIEEVEVESPSAARLLA